ncbi:MAG TPA: HemK family protein methyltransferase, partial [Candidatus Saccharimonadales bacterium]|nr:HemK family protein methyltransferase [Candidatus Saccharimonadales bacterium]
KEFYGRLFRVTPATLIPRPESETIITLLSEMISKNSSLLPTAPQQLVDVGTGSGCLGITAKLEIPELEVTLLDISRHALTVAEYNAKKLGATVAAHYSDLLSNYPLRADFIVANLPYVDTTWLRSPETNYEPQTALFAAEGGLHLIKRLIGQAEAHLSPHGSLLLEADPRQHAEIVTIAKSNGYSKREIRDFIIVLQKD